MISFALLACTASARAEIFTVSDATEFRAAILAANAHPDATSTIVFTADIALPDASPLPAASKPLTIDTGAFTLFAFDEPVGTGGHLRFGANSSVTIRGNFSGGDAGNTASHGGQGVAINTGSLTNYGTITGGTGGPSSFGGPGAALTGGFHVNHGVLRGGAANAAGGTAGTGLSLFTGGTLTNYGLIEGGDSSTIGGYGVVVDGSIASGSGTLINNGTVRGGEGGGAGAGVRLTALSTLINNGLVEGGTGALAIDVSRTVAFAAPPNGTIINSGTIRAGFGQTDAVRFQNLAGTVGTLELWAGSSIEGRVIGSVLGLNDTLRLGGATNSSFDVSTIGSAAQYRNFDAFEKTGAGNWTLTGTTAALTPWHLLGGTLSVSSNSALGDAAGSLTFDGGMLQVTGTGFTTTSRSIAWDAGGGGFDIADAANTFTLGQSFAGGGPLVKRGVGTLQFTGDSSAFAGSTSIEAGTLVVNGSLCGDMSVLSGGRLQGTGTVCDTTNFAGGLIAPGNSIGTMTVAGNYVGVGGTLEIETILGDDASPTDLLHITGNTSGTTNVDSINLGGTGAATVEGIRIVQVDGASDPGAFSLLGDFVFNGEQAVVAGAYAYRLYQGSVSAPGDGDWYLRSAVRAGDPVPAPLGAPLLQPGAPLYESYANVLQTFNQLRPMQQRVGNRSWGPGVIRNEAPDGLAEHNGIWGQIEATRGSFDPATSTTDASYDLNLWKLHAGADGLLLQNEEGSLVGGLSVSFGTVSASVSSPFGAGTINTQGYRLGGALTWYGTEGFYVDGQAQATFYNTDISSSTAWLSLVRGYGGFGYGASIEAGQQVELGSNWSVTPQAQLSYSNVGFSFNDAFGAPVTLEQGDSLVGRLGLSVDYEVEDEDTRSHLYGIANVYHDFAGDIVTDLASVDMVQRNDPLRGGVGVGGSYNWDSDKYSIFGEASVATSLTNPASGYAFNGNIGFQVRW